jgi:hypothetical protein
MVAVMQVDGDGIETRDNQVRTKNICSFYMYGIKIETKKYWNTLCYIPKPEPSQFLNCVGLIHFGMLS